MRTEGRRIVPENDLDRAMLRSIIQGQLCGPHGSGRTIGYAYEMERRGEDITVGLSSHPGDWGEDGRMVGYMSLLHPDLAARGFLEDLDCPQLPMSWWCEVRGGGRRTEIVVHWSIERGLDPSKVSLSGELPDLPTIAIPAAMPLFA